MSLNQIESLGEYTFVSRYAKYLPEKKRRENIKESIARYKNLMLDQYTGCGIEDELNFACDAYEEMLALGAQRALQFAGDALKRNNCRSYNCWASYCDRVRFFQETMFILLSGGGTGFSVERLHVNKLPEFVTPRLESKIFSIPDSIEGWSDAIGVLIASFLGGPEFAEYHGCEVIFDYSKIRPEGSPFSHGIGKAPGPKPLENAIEKIRGLLHAAVLSGRSRLRPIECYDIIMHSADAVLSGGIRRSATIVIFDRDDQEMMTAKTGNWFIENPQRGRSNNSCRLIRGKVTWEQFNEIIQYTRQYGEPGFFWADNEFQVPNPCIPDNSKLITPNGIRNLKDLNIGDTIWSNDGWTKIINKRLTGKHKIHQYITTAGSFVGTPHHKIVNDNVKIEVGQAESLDIAIGPYIEDISFDRQAVLDGLVIGDGTVHKASGNLVGLLIGENDQDYFTSEIKDLLIKDRSGIVKGFYEVQTTISSDELNYTYLRQIPDRYYYGSRNSVLSFLRGLYSANGSIVDNRVTLKTTSPVLRDQVQQLLSFVGIKSYFTTNKSTDVLFNNGIYTCKESYDVNIGTDRYKFDKIIGFIQKYKQEKLYNTLNSNPKIGKTNYDIKEIIDLGEHEVFDITVDNESHTYWCNGINTSNCLEINFWCYDSDGQTGWQACNLTTQNGKKIKNKQDWIRAVTAATILGTFQAGLTSFPYLGKTTENICRREALLGVSLTGWMENPKLLLDHANQKEMAQLAKEVNEKLAKKIKINPAARITCVKPEGTTSTMLGTSSGIHPHHARKFIRRIQENKLSRPAQYYRSINPIASEESVWSANNSDVVLSFACEVPQSAILKSDISAIEFLKIVKETQENWVWQGKNQQHCVDPTISNNVSNTCIVKPNEWDEVARYIFDNQQYFTGVSLLSDSGDKDYAQAPFTRILSLDEIVAEYGQASLFTSGLIEEGLNYFNGNLWSGCDCVLGKGENLESHKSEGDYKDKLILNKVNWVKRVKRFASRYFKNDLVKTTYLLKDIYNLKFYLDLQKNYKTINWEDMVEEENTTMGTKEVACAGGSCLI